MTARFGRNKRRRAREAIATLEQRKDELEHGMVIYRALLRNIGHQLTELKDEVARAKEIAGRYSSLFKPTVVKTDMPRPTNTRDGRYMVHIPEPLSVSIPSDDEALMYRTVQSMPLDIFLESVEQDFFNHNVHAMLQYKDGTMAYGVSAMTLMNETPDGIARALQYALPVMVKGLYEQAKIKPRQRRRA
jgi:hypothetical protein